MLVQAKTYSTLSPKIEIAESISSGVIIPVDNITLLPVPTNFSKNCLSVARAEAIKREAEALADNPQLIQLRVAEKWDGQLPKFTGETVPFISIDDFDK